MKRTLACLLASVLLCPLIAFAGAPASDGEYVDGVFRYYDTVTYDVILSYDTNRVTDPTDFWLFEWARQKMNINFVAEAVPNESRSERTLLLFLSSSMPEIILNWPDLDMGRMAMYGDGEGQLVALNEYFADPELMPNLSAICEELPQVIDKCRTAERNIYTFPRILQTPGLATTLSVPAIWYHAPTFEAAGYAQMPDTIEGLLEALRAVQQANPDITPVGGNSGDYPFLYPLLQAYGFVMENPRWRYVAMKGGDVLEGELCFFKADPLYYEALRYMNTLFTEGLLERDYYTLESSQVNAKLADGQYAMIAQHSLINNVSDSDWQSWKALGPITSAFSDLMISSDALGAGDACYYAFVTSACHDPAPFMRFMDYGYDKEKGYLYFHGPQVGVDDAYGMNGGWYYGDENKLSILYTDVETGATDHRNNYLANIGPFFAPYGLFDRRTDGSELALKSKEVKSQYAELELLEKYAAYKRDAYTGGSFDTDTYILLNDMGDLFDEYIETETAKFITGARPLNDSEWASYVETLRSLGMDGYMEIRQAAYDEQIIR